MAKPTDPYQGLDDVLHEVRGLAAAVSCVGMLLELNRDGGLPRPDDALQAIGGRIMELCDRADELVTALVRERPRAGAGAHG